MSIHDDGHTNIISTDSLRKIEEITDQHKTFKPDSFDLILTNPPFGAIVKSTEKDYLDTFDLGAKKKWKNLFCPDFQEFIDTIPSTQLIDINIINFRKGDLWHFSQKN